MAKKRDYKAEAAVYRKRIFQLLRISHPAVKLWQKEHGEPLTWPDIAKLIKWLTARCQIIPKRKSKVRRIKAWASIEVSGNVIASQDKDIVGLKKFRCIIEYKESPNAR